MPLNLGEKLGPLPVWAWAGIATAAAGAAFLWERSKNSASQASTAGSSGSDDAAPDYVFDITSQLPPEAGTPSQAGSAHPVVGQARKGPFRRVATGKESLAQIAKSRHTTVAHIVAVTKSSREISSASLAKFLTAAQHPNKPLPKGTVYYTSS